MTRISEPTGDLNVHSLAHLMEAEAGLDEGDGLAAVQAFMDIVGRHVAAGYRVRLNNFGSFERRTRRIGAGSLPSQRAAGARVPSEIFLMRFKATGRLADAVRSGEPIRTLRRRAKGAAGA